MQHRARLLTKLKPTSGLAHLLHLCLLVILPIAVFVLIRLHFVPLAYGVVLLSKWRMLAVRPRFWAANIRANAVDLMVGLSAVIFISHAQATWLQLTFGVLYALWLIILKPASGLVSTTLQAFIAQAVGLSALYIIWVDGPLAGLTLGVGLICYLAARHFFEAYAETYSKLLSYVWGYFGASLAWLTGHWLIFYHRLAQPALLLSALGYCLAMLYYLDHSGKLNKSLKRQLLTGTIIVVVAILLTSNWSNKVV
jgi:hypothetical protein